MKAPRPAGPQQPLAPRVMALFILTVGLTVLIGAFLIPEGGGYQAVGPRPFPMLVGTVGTLVGAIGVVQAFLVPRPRAQDGSVEPKEAKEPKEGEEAGAAEEPGTAAETAQGGRMPARWRPTFMLLGTLIAYALLMPPVGYWQATTVFYAGAARIQGSRKPLRDVLIGLVIALATYFVFDRLFGVDLPPGYLRLAF